MKGKLSKLRTGLLAATLAAAVTFGLNTNANAALRYISKESQACIGCHKGMNPVLVQQWGVSKHAENGVGCYECHKANRGDKDAFQHFGFTVTTILTPLDCGKCHPKEAKEFLNSRHSHASQFTGSLDNVVGRIVEGEALYNVGCAQCHGRENIPLKNGLPIKGPWPNEGIGRVNPDGSMGSCSACHYRHQFSLKQVRLPETCGKCHQGPDHPQIEVWELSKHGIAYKAHEAEIEQTLDHAKWVLGEDYYQAPNCVTCHMGATVNGVKATHDVGARLSWTLRPPISIHKPNWQAKRAEMKKVCSNCHQRVWIDSFYYQFDELVKLYNEKFAKPAKAILTFLHRRGLIDKTPFNDKIEWDFFLLWHHEGRRARHGIAMMDPDWTHWHGLFIVANDFYFKILPEADRIVKEKGTRKDKRDWAAFKKKLFSSPYHKWFKGLSKAELRKIAEFYAKRYGQSATGE